MAVDDSYTKSLLHMNGADASTTFTDESGKTWTARNNAQIDTAFYKFGGASGLFDGTGDSIDTPDHADFYVANNEFTVDLWFRHASTSATNGHWMFGQSDAAGAATTRSIECLIYPSTNVVEAVFSSGSTQVAIDSNSAISDTNWHHVAVVRSVNTLLLFVDGVKQTATGDLTGLTANNGTSVFSIGNMGIYNQGGVMWPGSFDEFRFTNGMARWTSNFNPYDIPYAPGGGQFIQWSS